MYEIFIMLANRKVEVDRWLLSDTHYLVHRLHYVQAQQVRTERHWKSYAQNETLLAIAINKQVTWWQRNSGKCVGHGPLLKKPKEKEIWRLQGKRWLLHVFPICTLHWLRYVISTRFRLKAIMNIWFHIRHVRYSWRGGGGSGVTAGWRGKAKCIIKYVYWLHEKKNHKVHCKNYK